MARGDGRAELSRWAEPHGHSPVWPWLGGPLAGKYYGWRPTLALGRDCALGIRAYVDDFRKHLPNSQTDWLFPGKASPNCPRDKPTFGVAISETIERFVGLRVNPHAFRAFAATMILESNPAALDDVRATLGHSGFNTALKHYRRHETKSAAARLAQHLRLERRLLPAPKATPKKRVIPTFALAGKI